jgi:4'-phosphopantetheinyl transferase EntD
MHPVPLPTITLPERLTDLIKVIGRRPCSSPVLLDLALMDQIDNEEFQADWLSEREKLQLNRFTLPKRRREWIAGRVCAKIAIEQYLEMYGLGKDIPRHDELSIVNSVMGRPYILVNKDYSIPELPDISISHSKGFALALASQSSCGVDIQKTSDAMIRVKERFCRSQEENLLLSSIENDNPLIHLTLLWAAKEAAQKALSIDRMPGLLDLELICIERDGSQELLFVFNRYHRHARAASKVRVLATAFAGYGLGICIPYPELTRNPG